MNARNRELAVGSMKNSILFAGVVASAVALLGSRAFATDAQDIYDFATVNQYVQYDNASGDYPIITAIASQGGITVGGKFFSFWTVMLQDGSGSLMPNFANTTLTTITASAGTTIQVGDKINMAGQWGPYHQIPEIGLSTVPSSNNYWQVISHGNATPAAPVFTISQITANNTIPDNIGGFYLEIHNATISGSTGSFQSTFPTYPQANVANESYTITDGTGSMTYFDWVTSYSVAAQLGGSAVPTGPVDLYGFVSYNTGGPLEFTALKIVPEPSTIALVGAGLLGLLTIRRRR